MLSLFIFVYFHSNWPILFEYELSQIPIVSKTKKLVNRKHMLTRGQLTMYFKHSMLKKIHNERARRVYF